jgi:hypothetical protein
MKAKNNDAVRQAIFRFSGHLVVSVITAICFFFCFMETSSVEVSRIVEKSGEYDRIRTLQLDLAEKVDTLYNYSSLVNVNSKINHRLMQNTLSSKKIQLSNALLSLSDKDCLIYKKLTNQMTVFLDTKDSIIVAALELDAVREQVNQCNAEVKKVKRRISTSGGLIFEK